MVFRRRFLSLAALGLLTLLVGCGNNDPKTPAAPRSFEERFAVKVGDRTVQMQVALLPTETQNGLMHRKALGENEGMLFVFDQPQPMSFWMRNTLIPLDIGFFDNTGVLKEIYPMYPRDENPVASRGRTLQFALEMNQGWYRTAGVKPGAKLDLAAVVAAIRARGLKPESFGLR
ncbi:hypothetical protein Verru16b_03416 [Lacunisphaera limnophila]|uniref:ACR n=1 Tax=Lacunisphaera limnophila TaxID=1838286 RepID=A0A1D8AZK9_9BACT|nr:DUF192 domain-containing protein [Lacunisphaera limnophila]AOS46315.1 hypothetical protein Verru16b_03416 [Lacunisphaera limnophila]